MSGLLHLDRARMDGYQSSSFLCTSSQLRIGTLSFDTFRSSPSRLSLSFGCLWVATRVEAKYFLSE